MRDQRIRMKLPQQCVYCGALDSLAVDHIIPKNRGGVDAGDNAVWACRSCNSSKRDRDLFRWWAASRPGLPPLFVIQVYLKQAIAYAGDAGLLDVPLAVVDDAVFDFAAVPVDYPQPPGLIFTPFHAERAAGET